MNRKNFFVDYLMAIDYFEKKAKSISGLTNIIYQTAREQIYSRFATIKELFYTLGLPQVRRVVDS